MGFVILYPGKTDLERKVAMELSWLQIMILSALQGISGVLPLSDSGFLSVARKLMGLPMDGSGDRLYTALLQLAVLLTVCLVFRRELAGCVLSVSSRRSIQKETRRLHERLFLLLIVGAIPGLLSLIIKGRVAYFQEHLVYIGLLMALSGFIVFLGDRLGKGSRNLPETTLSDGLWMGFAHSLSVIPGLSRMGLVTTVGFLRGLEPEFCFRFSFLLWIPYLAVRALSGVIAGAGETPFQWAYLAGMVLAGALSYVSLRLLRYCVRRGTTSGFAFALWGASLFAFVLYLMA